MMHPAGIRYATQQDLRKALSELLADHQGACRLIPHDLLRRARLGPQKVDDGLYPYGHQGDEDQGPGHCLVPRVQVAPDGVEDGARGEEEHADERLPEQQAREEAAREEEGRPQLKLRFAQRGARFSPRTLSRRPPPILMPVDPTGPAAKPGPCS